MIAHSCMAVFDQECMVSTDLVLVHEGEVTDRAVGQRHGRFERKVGDLLQGGSGHLVQLHQGLQPRLVEPQFLFYPLSVGGVYPASHEVGDRAEIQSPAGKPEVAQPILADNPGIYLRQPFLEDLPDLVGDKLPVIGKDGTEGVGPG